MTLIVVCPGFDKYHLIWGGVHSVNKPPTQYFPHLGFNTSLTSGSIEWAAPNDCQKTSLDELDKVERHLN